MAAQQAENSNMPIGESFSDWMVQKDLQELSTHLGDVSAFILHNIFMQQERLSFCIENYGSILNEEVRQDLKLITDTKGTITISLQSNSPCQCADGQDVTMLDLTIGPNVKDELQLVARYLLLLLKKRGLLNQTTPDSCHCNQSVPSEGQGEDEGGQQQQHMEEDDDDNNWFEVEEEDGSNEDDEEDSSEDYDFFEMPPRVTLDLNSFSRYGPKEQTRPKSSLLAPHLLRPVRKLINLHCDKDAAWVLQLLYDTTPHLEELQMLSPSWSHLEVMEQMPHLTRLDVQYYSGWYQYQNCSQEEMSMEQMKAAKENFVFKKPPSKHRGLQFLRVGHMPKKTTFSLVRAHRRTLEELWLSMGTWDTTGSPVSTAEDACWPTTCRDLHVQLGRCAAGDQWRLKHLVLFRWLYSHDKVACSEQLAAARTAVPPDCRVQCFECDRVPYAVL